MQKTFEKLIERSDFKDGFYNKQTLPQKYYKFPLCNIKDDLYPKEKIELDNNKHKHSGPSFDQQNELGLDIHKSYDLSVITKERYKTLYDWMHSWHLKNPIGQIHNQQPGQAHTFHMDVINSYNNYIADPKDKKTKVKRVFVFLNDWTAGQVIMAGTKIITGWKKGDVFWFDWYHVPHGTANFSRSNRMMLQITGETTSDFEKLIL